MMMRWHFGFNSSGEGFGWIWVWVKRSTIGLLMFCLSTSVFFMGWSGVGRG